MTYPIGGVDWIEKQKVLREWVVAGSGLPDTSVIYQGQDTARRPPAPAIEIKISNIAETGRTWTDVLSNPLTFTDKTITLVDPATNLITIVGHGLLTGDGPVRLTSTGTFPGNLPGATDFFVVAPDADHLLLASTYENTGGGQGSTNPITTIDILSAGTGTINLVATADTLRAGAETLAVARGLLRVTLELHCHTGPGVGMDTATAILHRVRARRTWPSQQNRLQAKNVGLIEVDRVRAILGTKDAVLFEPRAYCDIHFCVPSEEAENLTIINTIEVTDQVTGHVIDISGP